MKKKIRTGNKDRTKKPIDNRLRCPACKKKHKEYLTVKKLPYGFICTTCGNFFIPPKALAELLELAENPQNVVKPKDSGIIIVPR